VLINQEDARARVFRRVELPVVRFRGVDELRDDLLDDLRFDVASTLLIASVAFDWE
jgi:hypothetical protein